jgi:hypothetical protein
LAWIKEKERRAQVEGRSKKNIFRAFFDEIQRSIESFRNTDSIFDERYVSF